MKLENKTYDILKWIALICVPALAVAYQGLAGIWGWPYPQEIATTANIICTLLGALLGISTAEYNKTKEDQALIQCSNAENAKLIMDILAADEKGNIYN